MLKVSNVVYKKVEGELMVVTKPLTTAEKQKLPKLDILPSLAFIPSANGSPPVHIPFVSISKLQSSVSGSKVTLFKFDILPAFTAPSATPSPMPANFIFNFTGPKAEENRETVKKSLPNFPYVESTPVVSRLEDTILTDQNRESNAMDVDQAGLAPRSATPTKSLHPLFKSPPPNVVSQDSMEKSVMTSFSSQTTKKQRERRVERLRRDEKLRTAYHDLVIAPPHIFSDEDFWLSYAPEETGPSDDLEPEEGGISSNRSASASGPLSSPTSRNENADNTRNVTNTGVLDLMKQEQTRSIETELTAGTGFLDLLSKNFVDGRLKLVLTPALRKQIYEEYPLVRVAYNARVPSVLTPAAFWDAFFKAQLAKVLRKQAENEVSAAKERQRKTKSKSAKNSAAKASASASPASKPELTKEERETLFFERLTDATPSQLDALVWQSRASDSLSHDPAKSTQTTSRTSLLSYLAEDDATKRTETRHLGTNAPSVYDASTAISTATSGPTGDEMELSVVSKSADPISQQKMLLKNRIAQLSRSSAAGTNPSKLPQTVSYAASSSQGASDVITAEEMLFSALQEQSSLENSGHKGRKAASSAGNQAAMSTWYGSSANGGSSGNRVDPLSEKPSDAVELLDGIIVEAGELDDSSWTELKREKEKRNRHLQLIRKFNRHGHIVVSSASHASEAESTGDNDHGSSSDGTVATSGRSLRIKSSPSKAKETDRAAHSQIDKGSSMEVDASETGSGFEPIPFPSMDSDDVAPSSKEATKPVETAIPRSWASSKADHRNHQTSQMPSSESLDQFNMQLDQWLRSSYKAPARLKATMCDLEIEKGEAMNLDFNDLQGVLEKVDQWKRHFWNVMERVSSATSGGGAHFGLQSSAAEKLAPIVAKLQDRKSVV